MPSNFEELLPRLLQNCHGQGCLCGGGWPVQGQVGRLTGPRGVRGRHGTGRACGRREQDATRRTPAPEPRCAGLASRRRRPTANQGLHEGRVRQPSPKASPERSDGPGLLIHSLYFGRSAALVHNLQLPCGYPVHKGGCVCDPYLLARTRPLLEFTAASARQRGDVGASRAPRPARWRWSRPPSFPLADLAGETFPRNVAEHHGRGRHPPPDVQKAAHPAPCFPVGELAAEHCQGVVRGGLGAGMIVHGSPPSQAIKGPAGG
jgi:hypothetical protein